MNASIGRIALSLIGLVAGTVPGVLLWKAIDHPVGFLIFNCIVGGFIGFALTLPGVSTARVFGGAAAWIVAHNTSDAWGESAYKHIAGDPEPKCDPNSPAATSPPTHEAQPAESSRMSWGHVLGLLGLTLTIFCGWMQCRARQAAFEESQPKPISGQQLLEILRQSEGIDLMVVRPESTPKRGEPDAIEAELKERIRILQENSTKNWQEIGVAQKSLEYWQERKRREAAGLPSHPPAVLKIPQSR